MSRIGKKPIPYNNKDLKILYKDNLLNINGSFGELKYQIPNEVELDIQPDQISVLTDYAIANNRKMAGTARAIINNMVIGTSKGFEKKMELIGVGYRVQQPANDKLILNLGYSHPIEYVLPKEVTAKLDGNTKIILTSCDKQLLGQIASEIRALRPPEPYKGKGIKYADEIIIRKAGKTGKGAK